MSTDRVMLVLGVDPGAAATGYGLIEVGERHTVYRDGGVIRTPSNRALPERLHFIYRQFLDVVERHTPDEVAVESLFHARSPRTAITLGHARGVILLAAAQCRLTVADYTPLEIKKSVTGRGDASKEQVQDMVRRLIGAPAGLALDESDALAVALCHVHRLSGAVVQR